MRLSGTLFSRAHGFFFFTGRNVNSFPTGLDDIDSFTCQVLGKPLGPGLGPSGASDFSISETWPLGKNERHRLHLKISQLEFENHLPKAPFLGSSHLFSRMISWKTINFMQVKQFILEASTFLRFHYRWSHCHVLLWESHLR